MVGKEKRLPTVLSREEVRQILDCLRPPVYQACLGTIYACGLRIQEGVRIRWSATSTVHEWWCTSGRAKGARIATCRCQ
jgi:integrase